MKISHCSECGSPYADANSWPRSCECGAVRWLNPVPVAAVVQPVLLPDFTRGIVIAKRAIEPMKGNWSLVGGFMEVGESVEEAAAREFFEETGLKVASTPRLMFTLPVGGRERYQLMMMTCVDVPLRFEVFQQARPCPENEEIGLLTRDSDIELAFPTHRDAVRRYFGEHG
jgi:8-oxo-dGTP diphosphatase